MPPLAVVPVKGGPPLALVILLPPLAVAAVLAMRWAPTARAWLAGVKWLLGRLRARPAAVAAPIAALAAVGLLAWWAMQPVGAGEPAGGGAADEGDWPTFHGCPARLGSAGPVARAPAGRIAWKFRESQLLERRAFASSPAVVGHRVLIGSDNYKLYCLDLRTGKPCWTFGARWPVFSSPAVWNGRVYVGEGLHEHPNCRLYCLDLATGRLLWSIPTVSHVESSPTVADGRVFFGAGDDGLLCADARTGKVLWQYGNVHVDGGPLVVGGRVYAGSGYEFCGIVCLAASDGALLWRKPLPTAAWGAPAWSNGRLYVTLGNGTFEYGDEKPYGEVRRLDPATGKDIWRFTEVADAVLTSAAVAEGRVVFGSRDGECYALDAASGKFCWQTHVGPPVLSSPAVARGCVLFGADDGLFRCLALADGRILWTVDTTDDGSVIAPDPRIQSSTALAAGGQVVFGAANGHVYCLSDTSTASAPGAATGPAAGAATDPATAPAAPPAPAAPVVAETGRQSRLMWAADALVMGLLRRLTDWTASTGAALLLAAVSIAAVLTPLCWAQARLSARDSLDGGARPLIGAAIALAHLAAVVVVLLALQAGADLAGRRFGWIANLAAPDRLLRLRVAGGPVHVLPAVLAISAWAFWRLGRLRAGAGRRAGLAAGAIIAAAVCAATWRWPAGMHVFAAGLLWCAAIQARLLRAVGSTLRPAPQ